MSLDTVIIAFGALVAVLPFLQLPQDWTNFLAFIAGVTIVGLGIAVRRRGTRAEDEQPKLFEDDTQPEDVPVE